jgi:hypothetical protein
MDFGSSVITKVTLIRNSDLVTVVAIYTQRTGVVAASMTEGVATSTKGHGVCAS